MLYLRAHIFSVLLLFATSHRLQAYQSYNENYVENSTVVVDDDWFANWSKATSFVEENNYPEAITYYSYAIVSLDQKGSQVLLLGLYNARGSSYLELGEFEKAVEDFSYVIRASDSLSQDLLEARFKRAEAYLQLGNEEKCFKDIAYIVKNDPTLPKFSREGDYLMISNCSSDLQNTKTFKNIQVELGLHEFAEDVVSLAGNKYIVKTLAYDDECNSQTLSKNSIDTLSGEMLVRYLEVRHKGKHYDEKAEQRREERRIEDCKALCRIPARAAQLLCSRLPWHAGTACVGGVETLLWQCEGCCEDGFSTCALRFQNFIKKYGSKFFLIPNDPFLDD